MSILNEEIFKNEAAAWAFVEARVWPNGPICPHCRRSGNISKLGGESTRRGTYKCYDCSHPFTVKMDTVLEASRLPVHVWLQAIYLIAQLDSPMPSKELQSALGISQKTAKVIAYRLRKAMYSFDSSSPPARSCTSPRMAGDKSLPGTALPHYRTVMRDIFLSTNSSWGQP